MSKLAMLIAIEGGSLTRRPLPDVIAERITAAVAAGLLVPGERLPSEPELARELGVARTSLREALRKLQTVGTVRVVRGRGTFIGKPTLDDPIMGFVKWSNTNGIAVGELLEVRFSLESVAAGLACIRATEGDLDDLRARNEAHHAAQSSPSVDDLVATDQAVHRALVEASHNPALSQMYITLEPSLIEFRRQTLPLGGSATRSSYDHSGIIEAVAAREPREARRAVARHIWSIYEEVRLARNPTQTETHKETTSKLMQLFDLD